MSFRGEMKRRPSRAHDVREVLVVPRCQVVEFLMHALNVPAIQRCENKRELSGGYNFHLLYEALKELTFVGTCGREAPEERISNAEARGPDCSWPSSAPFPV